MPYIGFYGSDLSMQYFYTHCPGLALGSENLYQMTGIMCNNANNTHYAYPVLIYRFFSFTTFFNSFKMFYYFWSALIILTIMSLPYLWLKKQSHKFNLVYFAIGIITLIQAPSYFALERGGTDIAFLIPWMFATYLALKERWILAGIFMAAAALLKLYPVMAIMPIMLRLFIDDKNKIKFLKCCMVITVTVLINFALDWHLWKTFISEILPIETKYSIGTNAIGHSLIGPFPKLFVYPLMILFWFLYAQVFALKNNWSKKFTFAGVLAMSTYFNNHSFDYNLITAFPFIYLCFELYFDTESPYFGNQQIMWGILLLSFTLLGPANYLFSHFKFIMRMKLLIELFAFASIPLAILKKEFPNRKFRRHFFWGRYEEP